MLRLAGNSIRAVDGDAAPSLATIVLDDNEDVSVGKRFLQTSTLMLQLRRVHNRNNVTLRATDDFQLTFNRYECRDIAESHLVVDANIWDPRQLCRCLPEYMLCLT